MPRLNKTELIFFVVATVAGSCLHFLYTFVPCIATGLVAPVRESLWEHVKLLYWPCLISGVLLHRKQPGMLGQRAFALLAATAGMLGIGYVYHICLQGDSILVDIVLYVLMMALFFLLPHLLRQPLWQEYRELLALLVLALGVATMLFSFLPPQGLLFTDLSGTPTWVTLPC